MISSSVFLSLADIEAISYELEPFKISGELYIILSYLDVTVQVRYLRLESQISEEIMIGAGHTYVFTWKLLLLSFCGGMPLHSSLACHSVTEAE